MDTHALLAKLVALGCLLVAHMTFASPPLVTNVAAFQLDALEPVEIGYDLIDQDGGTCLVSIAVSTNAGGAYDVPAMHFTGDIGAGVTTGTQKQIVWDVVADFGTGVFCTTTRVRITANDGVPLYMVIDVSAGPSATNYPVSFLGDPPPLGNEFLTTRILLRKVCAGTFVMGSPTNELGRYPDEGPLHTVTFASNCYIGVCEVTQAQYTNVMGLSPAHYTGDTRPVEQVSWTTVRGGTWPGGAPAPVSFMGVLRAKTGRAFDLPTEAQWEYACRAGTTNALNSGINLTNTFRDGSLDVLGRYWYNGGNSNRHCAAGSYAPNAWGLYDMHGNVWEWCLDWYTNSFGGDVTDPAGPASGSYRVVRSGGWDSYAGDCRSAYRNGTVEAGTTDNQGFRLAVPAEGE